MAGVRLVILNIQTWILILIICYSSDSEVLIGTFINLIPDALVQNGASVGTMQRRLVRGNKNIW